MFYAQDNALVPRHKEVAVAFKNLESFGFSYRFGRSKSMWRINALVLEGDNNVQKGTTLYRGLKDSTTASSSSFGLNLKLGNELRKKIGDQIELRYGLDLSVEYSFRNYKTELDSIPYLKSNEYREVKSGLNLVLGLNYLITEKLILGLEVLPSFDYSIIKSEGVSEDFSVSDVYSSKTSFFS